MSCTPKSEGIIEFVMNGAVMASCEVGDCSDPSICEQTKNFSEAIVSCAAPQDFHDGNCYIREKSVYTDGEWWSDSPAETVNYIKRLYAMTHMDDPLAYTLSVNDNDDFLAGPKSDDLDFPDDDDDWDDDGETQELYELLGIIPNERVPF